MNIEFQEKITALQCLVKVSQTKQTKQDVAALGIVEEEASDKRQLEDGHQIYNLLLR